MSTKIDELFATLRGLVADQTRDLALAMAKLRSVTAERDNARQSLRAAESKSAAQGLTLATLCDLVLGEDAQDRSDDALVMAASKLAAERDSARLHIASLQSCLNSAAKSVRESEIAANSARQSLRAAEQDCDDMQSINSDLRTVNARLIAERDAAMERLNHAESLIMQ